MARLIVVDTADQLPGLLPLHAWSALMSSDLVLLHDADHPFVPHLEAAALRYEVVGEPPENLSMVGMDLQRAGAAAEGLRTQWRADRIVERAQDNGEVCYLYGPNDDDAFTRVLGLQAAESGVELEVVYFIGAPKGLRLLDLVSVEERLRGPQGCPWDIEQTHESLTPHAIEEVYELLDAVASGDSAEIREELGDVLLQVVFHAQIAEDEGTFTIDDVAGQIADKLVHRHPHVFADAEVADADEVLVNWEQLKAAEKPERGGLFDGIPSGLPALGYVTKLLGRAKRAGVGEVEQLGTPERLRAALDGLLAAEDEASQRERLGDLLFELVAQARAVSVDPELALRGAAQRFRDRVETEHGKSDPSSPAEG